MACFRPLKGYRAAQPGPSGKHPIVFSPRGGEYDRPVTLPCGQCIGCRLERSRQWALRCVHESKLWKDNCFITLTFNDAHLPADGSLDHEHWQLFMKRLKSRVRRKFGSEAADGIRFYMCGEYGPKLGRPHYHACLFNWDFPDKKYKRVNRVGDKIYTSEMLDETWGQADPGMCEIGAVSFDSAAYVARYIMKKVTGDEAETHYWFVDADGVVHDRKPEYTHMSRRPGIGKGWFDRWHGDVFPSDFIVHEGAKHRVPRYYDSLFEMQLQEQGLSRIRKLASLKGKRKRGAAKHKDDSTDRRLRDREIVQNARVTRLKRELEE